MMRSIPRAALPALSSAPRLADDRRGLVAVLASVLVLLLALAPAPTGALAQEPTPASPDGAATGTAPEASDGTVPFRLDLQVTTPEGEPVGAGLVAEDFEVLDDGVRRPVSRLGPPGSGAPERLVILMDLSLLSTSGLLAASAELAERARELTDLAPVEILAADPRVGAVLPLTDDPASVADSLSGLALRRGADASLAGVRSAWLDEARAVARAAEPSGLRFRSRSLGPDQRQRLEASIAAALEREAELLRRGREELLLWAAGEGSTGGAALLWVTGGFDEDSAGFYRLALERLGLDPTLADTVSPPVVLPTTAETGRVLSAYGWTVDPWLVRSGAGLSHGGSATPERRPPDLPRGLGDVQNPGSGRVDSPVRIRPGDLRGDDEEDGEGEEGGPIPLVIDPAVPLSTLAAQTGGELVGDALQLGGLLERLGGRVRLAWSAPPLEPGEARRLDVRLAPGAAPGTEVRSRQWATVLPPEAVAAVRARRLLERQGLDEGEVLVEAAVVPPAAGSGDGELLLRIESPREGPGVDPRRVRVTVAVGRGEPGGEALVSHRGLGTGRREGPDGEGFGVDATLHRLPVALPEGTDNRVVVLVDDLGTGRWGAGFASVVEAGEDLAGLGEAFGDEIETGPTEELGPDTGLLPAPKPIGLLAPDEPFLFGEQRFNTVLADASIRRVEFLLDGERAATVERPPFTAVLDLGDVPRSRRLEVLAYDGDGELVGRDGRTLNEGAGRFRVRIVDPREEDAVDREAPLAGPVDVEVEITDPGDAPVERVEWFWNTELSATRFGPPWRQRIVIPSDAPQGFLRVVARLDDGTVAEDVLFVNGPGTGERLDVDLVELYVVVTDDDGRPVSGLERDDFEVFEEGDEQEVATFSDAGDLPLTVGLAIDSSASMFVKLPAVGRVATEFVDDTLGERDRAFVVGFGGEPRLAQETTSDKGRLAGAIGNLRPDGQTALWESIVYSLVQIQGGSGKKALIVYTDGADEDEDFSYSTAQRFARRLGIPIYVILTNNEIVRTGGKGFSVRRFLGRVERLAESSGGRVYLTRHGADLQEVYAEIGEELRSQYLLAYYPSEEARGEWRRVRVEVLAADLEARTVAGYFR